MRQRSDAEIGIDPGADHWEMAERLSSG